MDVGLDFHGRVHRPMAKQLAKALEPLGLLFIEEPLLSENPEGLAQIAALVSTPIALGERLYSRWDFKPFFEAGAVDIIQPDLSHAGGILECRKIAAMAEAYDVAVAPHCPLGPLALAVLPAARRLHAQRRHPGDEPRHPLQCRRRPAHLSARNKEQLTPVDGYLPIPTGPGLGVDIDEDAVREADKDRHRWRNPVWRSPTAVSRNGSYAARRLRLVGKWQTTPSSSCSRSSACRWRGADDIGVARVVGGFFVGLVAHVADVSLRPKISSPFMRSSASAKSGRLSRTARPACR